MATVNFTGLETGDLGEFQASGGTVSVQSGTVRSGTYALRCNPTTTATGWARLAGLAADGTNANANVATSWVRCYFRFATKPAANDEPLLAFFSGAGIGLEFELRLTSGGLLAAYDSGAILMATGTTVLSSGTFYRLEVKRATGASAAWEVKIDGAVEISGTGNLSANNADSVTFGKQANRNGQTVDYFFDDILWSDSAYPGAGACHILVPTADGHYTGWSALGNKWQQVNEVPEDGSSTVITTGNDADAYTATLTHAAAAGVTGTPNCVKPVAFAELTGGSPTLKVRLRSASTDSDTSAATLTGSFVAYCKLLDADPATSAAWLLSAIDSLEGGVVSALTPIAGISTTAVYVMVDSAPAAAVAGPPAPRVFYREPERWQYEE